MFHVKHPKTDYQTNIHNQASDFFDPVKNAINEIDPGHGLTCNCKGTEQLRTHYKINEKYQKNTPIYSLWHYLYHESM